MASTKTKRPPPQAPPKTPRLSRDEKRDPVVREARYRQRVYREPPIVERGAKKSDPRYTTPRERGSRGYRGARAGARGTRRGLHAVTHRKSYRHDPAHTLTIELIAGLAIVLVRVVADYEPQASGTIKGKVGHPRGQYGPLPIAAGLIATFFILSFAVRRGGLLAGAANALGGLVVLALGMKSVDEFDTVVKTFGDWGKGQRPKGAWETTGVPAGDPLQGSGAGSSSSGSGSGFGSNPAPEPGHVPGGGTTKSFCETHPDQCTIGPPQS